MAGDRSSLTHNRYTYVNGDPINYADPTGHILEECARGEYKCERRGEAFIPVMEMGSYRRARSSLVDAGLEDPSLAQIRVADRAIGAFRDAVNSAREQAMGGSGLLGDPLSYCVNTYDRWSFENDDVSLSCARTAGLDYTDSDIIGQVFEYGSRCAKWLTESGSVYSSCPKSDPSYVNGRAAGMALSAGCGRTGSQQRASLNCEYVEAVDFSSAFEHVVLSAELCVTACLTFAVQDARLSITTGHVGLGGTVSIGVASNGDVCSRSDHSLGGSYVPGIGGYGTVGYRDHSRRFDDVEGGVSARLGASAAGGPTWSILSPC